MHRAISTLASALAAVAFLAPAATLPALQRFWQASPESLGLVVCAVIAGAGVSTLLGAGVAPRLGSRRTLALAAAGLVISALSFVSLPSVHGAAAVAFCMGLSGGLLETAAQRHAARPGAHGGEALAQIAFVAGTILGPVAAGWLAHTAMGWRGTFAAVALIASVIAVGAWRLRPAEPAPLPGDRLGAPAAPLSWRAVVVGFCVAGSAGAPLVLSSWLVYYLVVARGLAWFPAAVALGLFWGTLAVGRLACHWIASHVPTPTLLWASALVAAVACGSLPLVSDRRWLFVGIALAGLGSAAQFPLLAAWMGSRWHDADPSSVAALLAASGDLWAAAGVLAVGALAARAHALFLAGFGEGPLRVDAPGLGILALAAVMFVLALAFRLAARRDGRSGHPGLVEDADVAAAAV